MIRKWILRALTPLLTLGAVVCPADAAQVCTESVYCFSEADLPEQIAGICVTGLSETGTVYLADRQIRPGDVLTAGQARQLTLAADTRQDQAFRLDYLPVFQDHVDPEMAVTFSLRGRENKAPVAEDQALETYKNLPNSGKLKVSDPEEEPLTYTLVRQPRRGTVELTEDGSFTYTPKKNKVGVDSFTYTASDPAGKVSREATVTVTILKPSDAAQYTDTLGQDCRFAAEWMRHTGIFTGEALAGNACFGPEKPVTQGEFLTMTLKALEIPPEPELTFTGCEDAPAWLRPYLAAAIRSGLTAALPTFGADTVITGPEAARVLKEALDTDAFAHPDDSQLTRAQAAQMLYEAACLRENRKTDTTL